MQNKSGPNRVWLRTVTHDDKILKEKVFYCRVDGLSVFLEDIREICEELDEPMPVILKSHLSDLRHFNVTRFLARDFVESIYFERMILELVK